MYTVLHDWIVDVTGYSDQNVIRSNQSGMRPLGDYVTYYLLSENQSVYADWNKIDAGEDDDVFVDYDIYSQIIITIDVYALGGFDVLNQLAMSKNLLTTRNILRQENMVLISKGDTRNLTALGDTGWLDRFNADFTFHRSVVMRERNQKILQYQLYGEFGDLDSSIET